MEFRLLGPFEVVHGGQALHLGGHKQRAVLVVLALHANRVVSLDSLIDELWGEEPPQRAIATLQAYVWNLRQVLEPDRPAREPPRLLVTQSPGYRLVLDAAALDSVRFEGAVSEGRRLLERGDLARARDELEAALGLWRGPALADFAFEPFAQAEAARLEELRLAATEDRIQTILELGTPAPTVPELERLTAAYPLRERLWGLLMLALYRSERQADALRAYQAARRTIRSELGIEPSAALRQLESDILSHAPSLEWRAPGSASRPVLGRAPQRVEQPAQGPPKQNRAMLVGRTTELARLEAILQRVAAGAGAVVLLKGEAGIGKTRLAEELVERAVVRGLAAGWGGSVDGGGTPAYRPWSEIVRSLLASASSVDVRHSVVAFASELAQMVPELDELVEPGTVLPPVDPETARLRLFQAVVGFFKELGRHHGVLLVLDDLQWADPASLQLLGFLASQLRGSGVVVVGAYRPEEVDLAHPLQDTLAVLSRHAVVERVDLRGLSLDEVGCLLAATIGTPVQPDVAAAVRDRTEGNPFFVTELARTLATRPHVHDERPTGSAVPSGVHDVLRQRLARLPEQTLAVLNMAAVAGREFHLGVIEAATGLQPERLVEMAEAAVMMGVVLEHPEEVGRLRFSHDLVRETLLDGLTVLRRVRLHARLAEAIQRLYGDDAQHAIELAHHLSAAAPVLGAERAIAPLLRAAEVASAQLAHEQAEEQLRRALKLIGQLPPTRDRDRTHLDVLLRLNSVLAVSRGFGDPEIGEVLDAARRLCSSLGESEEITRALFGLMLFHLVAGRYRPALAVGSQLLAIATESGRPADMVAAHLAVGIPAIQQGDLGTANLHLEAAFRLEEGLNDPSLVRWFPMHPVICTSCFLAWAVWERGDRTGASQLVEDALEFAVRLGHNLTIAHALDASTRIAVMDGNSRRALERSERALMMRGSTSSPLYDAIHAVHHGWARAQQGECEEGIAELEAGVQAMERTGAWMLHTLFLTLLADAQRAGGRVDEALASIDRAFGFVERIDEHFWECELHRLRGELLLERCPENTEVALRELETALAIARRRGAVSLEARANESIERFHAALDSAR